MPIAYPWALMGVGWFASLISTAAHHQGDQALTTFTACCNAFDFLILVNTIYVKLHACDADFIVYDAL